MEMTYCRHRQGGDGLVFCKFWHGAIHPSRPQYSSYFWEIHHETSLQNVAQLYKRANQSNLLAKDDEALFISSRLGMTNLY